MTDDFEVNGGVLTFKKSPDFENPTDRVRVADDSVTPDVTAIAGNDNDYQVTVRATELLAWRARILRPCRACST